MSIMTSGRLARLRLFPFDCRGHKVGYFEDSPGNRYQVTTAWCNSAGEWHEHHMLYGSIPEAAERIGELVDYGRTVERMERDLGRPLTWDELPKDADPRDQVDPPAEPLPCPFCGGPAEATVVDGDHLVSCAARVGCSVYVVAGPYTAADKAVRAWNRRADRSTKP